MHAHHERQKCLRGLTFNAAGMANAWWADQQNIRLWGELRCDKSAIFSMLLGVDFHHAEFWECFLCFPSARIFLFSFVQICFFRIRTTRIKAHTDRTRFGNATRIFSFQKQIKTSMDKNFTLYAVQIAKIA